jgi:hypothetical protein
MKYIKRFICSLSPDVKITKSHISDSEYIKLDGGFTIRLSDHIPVNPLHGIHLYITTAFRSDKFILFTGKSNIPMVKTRKEIKDHIRITYENWSMERAKELSDCRNKLILKPQYCTSVEDFIEYNNDFVGFNDKAGRSLSILATLPKTGIIPKDVRNYILKTHVRRDKVINVAEFLHIAVTSAKDLKDEACADRIVKRYVNAKNNNDEVA